MRQIRPNDFQLFEQRCAILSNRIKVALYWRRVELALLVYDYPSLRIGAPEWALHLQH